MMVSSLLDDNSTCLRLWFVTMINASQREQRIVLPSDLSSLITSFSSLSSLSHVGQSLGSFDMVMISLMKIVLPIMYGLELIKKEFVLSIGIQQFSLKHQTV